MIPEAITDPSDPTDEWALSNNGYAPDKFYLRASDSRGHHSMIHTNMSPNLHAQINELIANENLPYKTQAAFVRDAAVHRLRWLMEQEKAGVQMYTGLAEELLLDRLRSEKDRMALREEVCKEVWEHIARLLATGQSDAALEEVDAYEDVVWEEYDKRDRKVYMREVTKMREHLKLPAGSTLPAAHHG